MGSHFDDEELSMSLSSPPPRGPTRPSAQTRASAYAHREAYENGHRYPDTSKTGKVEQRIGQYSVKKTLGEGSFGKVKLAVHRVSGQEVALKIISRKKLISRDMAGRVEREIQYLQLLRHPHIIKLYTVITTPNEIIMVLEYAGEELFDYIVKHGKMSEVKARRFFQQIVCAVEYCHRHKIVHRDLKPENLLLDSDLNVKIADFGLSNIMTDGNFLKTSCGSPNYAAPEVISGKLYAGPEVDVWSCGIILYVLLIGRLPFDDDFIPALFRKINSGTYHIPSYLSSGARDLIQRMLKVNPVQRITIQEIRQNEWFNQDLEEYLKPSVEEFMDTGVDPNKAIDPKQLAPGKPAAVQEQIHQSVIGKLGKTMGYAKADVQEALGKDEPNAIKDAYMIVRENQIMKNNPALTTNTNAMPFMAQSPPAWDGPNTPFHVASPLQLPEEPKAQTHVLRNEGTAVLSPITASSITSTDIKDTYVSKISILASSLPFYHSQFMEHYKKERFTHRSVDSGDRHSHLGEADPSRESEPTPSVQIDAAPIQSPEEQAETARRLKPHSRSSIKLQEITSQPPSRPADEQRSDSKKGRTRWQFGIRSRNVPHEAMHCVYKALKAQGAEWEVPPPLSGSSTLYPPSTYPVNVRGATSINETIQTRSNSPEQGRFMRGALNNARNSAEHGRNNGSFRSGYGDGSIDGDSAPAGSPGHPRGYHDGDSSSDGETDDEDIDPNAAPENYVPKDPWCIRVRWRKDGMAPIPLSSAPRSSGGAVGGAAGVGSSAGLSRAAGSGSLLSANSSRQDLHDGPPLVPGTLSAAPSRPGSAMMGGVPGALGSAAASTTSFSATSAAGGADDGQPPRPSAETSCYVYMDVQLYTLEPPSDKSSGTFLVDFKCAGYESLIEQAVDGAERALVGSGLRVEYKDVTSPQPFLDLTNKLVIHLASG